MNNCQDYFVYMNQYLDGELPPQETEELLRHLEICEGCRRRFEALRRMVEETRALSADPPADLHAAIMAGVRRERAPRRGLIRLGGRTGRRALVRIGGLAACLVLLAALFDVASPWLGRTGGDDTASDEAAAPEAALFDAAPGEGAEASRSVQSYAQPAPDGAANGILAPESGDMTGDAATDGSAPGYDHAPLAVDGLEEAGPSAFYVVAVGTGDLSAVFGGDVPVEERTDRICVQIENTENARDEAEQALIEAGFTVCDNVEGLPEIDENAQTGLVIVYEDK